MTSETARFLLVTEPAGFEDMARRVPDVGKLERVTGFRPRLPLDRIIEDIVAEKRAARRRA